MDTGADSGAWDCIVVGAGPAGLNAALVLGRARRRVVVLDNAQPRNYATHEMHGVLGHDGLDPAELRARGRAELAHYGVQVVPLEVQDAEVPDGAVRVTCAGRTELTRMVVLATGMLDELPAIPGFRRRVGNQTAHLSVLRRLRAPRRAPRRPRRRRPRRAPRGAPAPVVRQRRPAQTRSCAARGWWRRGAPRGRVRACACPDPDARLLPEARRRSVGRRRRWPTRFCRAIAAPRVDQPTALTSQLRHGAASSLRGPEADARAGAVATAPRHRSAPRPNERRPSAR